MLTDKGEVNGEPLDSVAKAMGQAHKQQLLSTTNRVAKYGWTPGRSASDASEQFYHMTHDIMQPKDVTCLKVLQHVEAGTGKITHRINLMMQATLKDSQATN